MGKRAKRALRATIFALGYQNKSSIAISILLFVIALFILQNMVGSEQMAEQLNWGLAVLAALGAVFVVLFLFNLIKSPAPRRDGINFIVDYREHRIVSGKSVGLPPAEDNMHWVQVYTYLEAKFPTKVKALKLILKGRPIMANGWMSGTMNKGSSHQRFYYFQVPTSIDLTKYKAELVAFTDDENYGSGEFTIKQ